MNGLVAGRQLYRCVGDRCLGTGRLTLELGIKAVTLKSCNMSGADRA